MPKNIKNIFIAGRKLFLRAIEASDINTEYVGWLNDPAINTFMATRRFPTTLEDLKKFYTTIKADKNAVYFAICLQSDGRHIGNIKLDKIDWISRVSEFGILIGDQKHWGQGYCAESTYLITKHGFNQLNLKRITIFLAEENQAALKCYEKAGYLSEGVLRKAVFLNGSYHNIICMGQLQKEFKRVSEFEHCNAA